MRKILACLLLFLVFLLIGLTYVSREFLFPKQQGKKTVRVVIQRGMRAYEIARVLDEEGVIRNAWSFQLLARLTKTGGKIVAGTYDLSPSLSEVEILRLLSRGEGVLCRVTIPEGYNLKQIARLLDSQGVVGMDFFLEKARDQAFEVPEAGLELRGVEGVLFPDTYDLQPRISPEDAMKPMLERFKGLVLPEYLNAHLKLSLKEVIILASLIEKEGKMKKELPLISSVYYNRLKDHMPLQCDATIQYLLPNPKEFLSAEDLKIDSPYNTYLHAGLPPGPIGSPGLDAIKAALYPAGTAYRYYVLQSPGDRHVFSATYAEHLRAVERYSEWLKKKP